MFAALQDTRIRVIEKGRPAPTSRRLSVINPSPEGSRTHVFGADSGQELEDWLDALCQHLFDQGECVPAGMLWAGEGRTAHLSPR